jgi:hypothetical protein
MRPVLDAFALLRKATIRFVTRICHSVSLFVCPSAWNVSGPTGRILIEFYI